MAGAFSCDAIRIGRRDVNLDPPPLGEGDHAEHGGGGPTRLGAESTAHRSILKPAAPGIAAPPPRFSPARAFARAFLAGIASGDSMPPLRGGRASPPSPSVGGSWP